MGARRGGGGLFALVERRPTLGVQWIELLLEGPDGRFSGKTSPVFDYMTPNIQPSIRAIFSSSGLREGWKKRAKSPLRSACRIHSETE